MVPDVHEFSRHDLHRDDDHRLPCDDHPAFEPDVMVNPDEASEGLRVVIAEDDCDQHQGRCLSRNEVA